MPEGDTIHRVRAALAPHLLEAALVALHVDRQPIAEPQRLRVTSCEAVGKHLLLTFARDDGSGFGVRVHLGMKGTWHSYVPREPWRRHPDRARLIIATASRVFVCFDPKEVAQTRRGHGTEAAVSRVGPDLLAPRPDLMTIMANARAPAHAGAAIADLLLTQSVAGGIGNVYKSEVLFMAGVDPWRPASALSDGALRSLFALAAAMLADNTARGGWRLTTDARACAHAPPPRRDLLRPTRGLPRHWVYRRANRPCLVCGGPIRSQLQGPMARMTYWCAGCQREDLQPDVTSVF
jgi:endonuclease-8